MKNEIFDFIKSRNNVSMVELSNNIAGFKGNLDWYFGNNTVIWDHCSHEAIEALVSLIEERKIKVDVVDSSVYLLDGAVPPYPVANTPFRDTKKAQWIPMVFSVVN